MNLFKIDYHFHLFKIIGFRFRSCSQKPLSVSLRSYLRHVICCHPVCYCSSCYLCLVITVMWVLWWAGVHFPSVTAPFSSSRASSRLLSCVAGQTPHSTNSAKLSICSPLTWTIGYATSTSRYTFKMCWTFSSLKTRINLIIHTIINNNNNNKKNLVTHAVIA